MRTAEPAEAVGSHTTPSAIGVTSTGIVSAPAAVVMVSFSPSLSPAAAAVAGDTRATTGRAVVQSDGHAFRLNGTLLKQEFNRLGALQHLLLRYTQALITQMTQTAACNKHHSVPQQLCRWLLLGLDRLPANKLMMTQGLIATCWACVAKA